MVYYCVMLFYRTSSIYVSVSTVLYTCRNSLYWGRCCVDVDWYIWVLIETGIDFYNYLRGWAFTWCVTHTITMSILTENSTFLMFFPTMRNNSLYCGICCMKMDGYLRVLIETGVESYNYLIGLPFTLCFMHAVPMSIKTEISKYMFLSHNLKVLFFSNLSLLPRSVVLIPTRRILCRRSFI